MTCKTCKGSGALSIGFCGACRGWGSYALVVMRDGNVVRSYARSRPPVLPKVKKTRKAQVHA